MVKDNVLQCAYIMPHLDYCVTVWGECSDLNKLVKLQKQAARIILDCHYLTPSKDMYCIVLIALSRCNRVFTRRLGLCHSHTVRHHEVRKGEREGLNRVVRGR